jgi:hypothetical protein
MSLIDPTLFKGEPEVGGGTPFASAYASPRRTGAGFVDPRPLTAWTRWMLWIEAGLAALALLALITDLAGLTNLTSGEYGETPTPLQLAYGLVGLSLIAMIFVRGFLCLRWMWRANKNAHSLASMIETSPGWAWGAFFIPFWNLFKPFQTMSEIWRSAESPTSWRGLSTPTIVWAWWGLWIGAGVLSGVGRVMGQAGGGQSPFISILLVAMAVAINLVFANMIGHVAERQVQAKDDTVFD